MVTSDLIYRTGAPLLNYINILPEYLKHTNRLFTDYCIMYKKIRFQKDCLDLHSDQKAAFHHDKCNLVLLPTKHVRTLDPMPNASKKRIDFYVLVGSAWENPSIFYIPWWLSHVNLTAVISGHLQYPASGRPFSSKNL